LIKVNLINFWLVQRSWVATVVAGELERLENRFSVNGKMKGEHINVVELSKSNQIQFTWPRSA
jgi:hypothetical protein